MTEPAEQIKILTEAGKSFENAHRRTFASLQRSTAGLVLGMAAAGVSIHGAYKDSAIEEFGGLTAAVVAGGYALHQRERFYKGLAQQVGLGMLAVEMTSPSMNPNAIPAQIWMRDALPPEIRWKLCIDIYQKSDNPELRTAADLIAPDLNQFRRTTLDEGVEG